MSDNKITLHHLNNSQSQRIIWLLEELGIEYNLCLYFRDPLTQRAPTKLTTIHPLGKSLVLVTENGLAISESMTITTYLLNTYDHACKYHEGDIHSSEFYLEDSLVSFSGATLYVTEMISLIVEMMEKRTQFPFNWLSRMITKRLKTFFIEPELKKALTYLDNILGEKEWFMTEGPKKADFMLSFPLDLMVHRGWVDLKTDFPRLAAWRERCLAREAWKSALNKGNGYDLNVF